MYVVGYKCATISEESAGSFFKVEDKFLSQETTGVSIQLDACPLLIVEATLILTVTTVRWYYNGARVVGDGHHPASCWLSKEQQVNPEGALVVRTGNKNYMWDMVFSYGVLIWCSHREIVKNFNPSGMLRRIN